MKKIIMASLFSAVLLSTPLTLLPAGAISSSNDVSSQKGYVNVSYTAEKEVSPDTVEISIAVRTEDKKSMQEAVNKNKELSDKIYSYLKSAINSTNNDYLKTLNYSASPTYIYNNGKKSFDKYVVSNNIVVHTKSIDKISEMIDKSLTLGATNVDSLNFSLSEKDAQCSELLVSATKQARKRADIVAAAAGSSVTGIKSIETSCSVNNIYNGVNYARNSLMMKAGGFADAAAPEAAAPIESGVIKIYSNVNAKFYIK